MKKLLFSLTALVLSTGLFAQKKADDVAKFKTETIDMGKIKQDNPSTAVFEVTNVGTEPLIIEQANPTCGCTIGDYTKEPIAPGKTGFIKATYNAHNLLAFDKKLTVKFAGTDDIKTITIKGEVLNAEEYAKLNGAATPNVEPKADKLVKVDSKTKSATAAKVPVKKTKVTKSKTTTLSKSKK